MERIKRGRARVLAMALTGSGLARAPHGFSPKISGRLREAGGAFRREKARRRPGGAENEVRGGENAAPDGGVPLTWEELKNLDKLRKNRYKNR